MVSKKNPAFLFYTSDFLTGTMLMTNEQVGKYIRLLCLQHQQGHLTEEDMLNICSSYDNRIFSKFIQDSDKKYYNVRLEEEKNKRDAYCDSRKANKSSKKEDMINTSSTYDKHMDNDNINEYVNDKEKKTTIAFKIPTIDEVQAYANEKGYQMDCEHFIAFYESNGWRVGKNPMKSWKASITNWVKQQKNFEKPKYQTRDEKLKEDASKITLDKSKGFRGLEI